MMHSPLSTWVRSVAVATAVTSLILAVLIVSAEEIPALKDWLKETFYHHWLGKGALSLMLFAATTLALQLKRGTPDLSAYIIVETAAVAASVCAIAVYFLLHTLGVV